MRQTARINRSFSFTSFQWLIVLLLLLLIASSYTAAQYASSTYNSQLYGYNQLQVQQLQQQLHQQSGYPDAPLTYTRQYPAAADVQSVWSSAPIVVTDEANRLEQKRQQQERGYLPINFYNNGETYATVQSDRRQPNWINNNNNYVPTTRAANHNYNNVPGYFYHQQPQTQTQQQLEQRELLAVADSQREEEQIVRIGGSHSLALNNNNNNDDDYYEPTQTWGRRNHESKYAKHFSDYLRKYPQRLLPFYNTGTSFVDK